MDAQNWFPQVNSVICIGCGECIRICPTNALVALNNYPVIRAPIICNYCGLCEKVCSVSAIGLPYLVCKRDESRNIDVQEEQMNMSSESNPKNYTFLENLSALITEIPADSIVSRTFYKDDHLNAVLFGFAPGQALSEHRAGQPATIHILSGSAVVTLGEDTYQVESGAWMHMPQHLKHSIVAKSQLVMLLLLLKQESAE